MAVSAEKFRQTLVASGLLESAEIERFCNELQPAAADGQALARALIRAEKLTKYQAAAVYQGKTKGLLLGNYKILDKIGAGGMGQVFKAEHRRMERLVAIKILPPRATNSPEAIERFQREVKAAARLEHANIVTAHDADESQGVHFLVMQYVDGSDLASIVKGEGPLAVEGAVDYILQTARGLAYAHEQGIVHRDIKPANLLVDPQGTVKILDMGLARFDDSVGAESAQAALTQSGQIMGTVDFMSPEQAEDTRQADFRSDIYSLGCTLFTLLAGKAIYGGDTIMRKLIGHREAAIPSICEARSDAPPALEAIFRQMVAKEPADRQASMNVVVAQLEQCLADQPRPTLRQTPPARRSSQSPSSGALSKQSVAVPMGIERPVSPPSVAPTVKHAANLAGPAPDATFVGGNTQIGPPSLPAGPAVVATPRHRQRKKQALPVWLLAVIGGVVTLLLLLTVAGAIWFGSGDEAGNDDGGNLANMQNNTPAATVVDIMAGGPPQLVVATPSGDPRRDLLGEYVGKRKVDGATYENYAAQVYDVGNNKLRAAIYPQGLPGQATANGKIAFTLDGIRRGETAVFQNERWLIEAGQMTLFDAGLGETITLDRVERRSVTLGAAPPPDAIVWHGKGSLQAKSTPDGYLRVGATTKRMFQDLLLHVEFRVPHLPEKSGQGRGNSGVFLQGRYEVQILDSFGVDPTNTSGAGLYGVAAPQVNMCFPPLEWQTYDIEFKAARFDAAGKKIRNARLTLRHNGVLVHDRVELPDSTLGNQFPEGPSPGPVVLQDHGDDVRFRNVWAVESATGTAAETGANEPGFVSIFDGRSLSGWDGDPRIWAVGGEGAIIGRTTAETKATQNTCLIWDGGPLDDFELRLKYRIDSGNSGVQIRSQRSGNWVMAGYQIDIDAGNTYTGGLYDEKGRGILATAGQKVVYQQDGSKTVSGATSAAGQIATIVRSNDWNDLHIVAQGDSIIVKINGVTTLEVSDHDQANKETAGLLGLQLHSGPPMTVQFKDIRLKRLAK